MNSEDLIVNLNTLAQEQIKNGKCKASLHLLQKAHSLSANNPKLLATTYENLGTYHKQTGNLDLAEQFYVKALSCGQSMVSSHINLCSILSSKGNHREALLQASFAYESLRNSEKSYNNSVSIVIALHNMAVEYEILQQFEKSLVNYRRALRIGEQRLGSKHELIQSVRNNYLRLVNASGQLPSIKKKPNIRRNSMINTRAVRRPQTRPTSFRGKRNIPVNATFDIMKKNLCASRHHLQIRKDRSKAAVCIQKHWRGFFARKKFRHIKRQKNALRVERDICDLENFKRIAQEENFFRVEDILQPLNSSFMSYTAINTRYSYETCKYSSKPFL